MALGRSQALADAGKGDIVGHRDGVNAVARCWGLRGRVLSHGLTLCEFCAQAWNRGPFSPRPASD